MKIIIILFFIGFLISVAQASYILPQPPKIEDKTVSEYLRILYNRYNHTRVVATSPNGSQLGDYGEFEILKSGANFYLEVNTSSPSGTSWLGVQLTAVP